MFKTRLPEYLEHIRDEYSKWLHNKFRYNLLYPVTSKIFEHITKNKGKYYGITKKRKDTTS